jgi:hypothetical protein
MIREFGGFRQFCVVMLEATMFATVVVMLSATVTGGVVYGLYLASR